MAQEHLLHKNLTHGDRVFFSCKRYLLSQLSDKQAWSAQDQVYCNCQQRYFQSNSLFNLQLLRIANKRDVLSKCKLRLILIARRTPLDFNLDKRKQ